MTKSEIRKQMIVWRKSLPQSEVIKRSQQIGVRLFSLSEFRLAKRILFYVSYNNEVATHSLVKHALHYRKEIFIPISQVELHTLEISKLVEFDQDLIPSTYGILEPKPDCVRLANPKELDMVIVPGIAFDIRGYRLGHGVGYYDNFLRCLSPMIKTIGLAFKEQILPELPKTENDVPVNKIITENKIYNCAHGIVK
jgi:5-formyltetrahydrofolate cyclo-ligase